MTEGGETMHSKPHHRRAFLKTGLGAAAVAALPPAIPASALGLAGRTAPSNRVTMAAIGLGFGWPMFLREDARYLAVCDVQRDRREQGKAHVDGVQKSTDCRAYRDFRDVLAREDIDAVYVATPDHWHALVTLAAVRAGKHVYCQKPLTRTIAEGRAVVEAVRRYGVVFQHGTQQRHDPQMLLGCELVLNGYVGRLKDVRIGSPAGPSTSPWKPEPVPVGLDYEMWLGPAPWAPFTPLRIAAHPWYHISDYCTGYIAGWGVHHADSAVQGSGLDHDDGPIEIDARGIFPAEGLFDNPYRWQMRYRFASGLTWHWTDCEGDGFGSRAGPDWPQNRMGITLEGSEGSVFIWRGQVDAQPKSLLKVQIGPDAKVQLRRPLRGDFLDCVRNRLPTCAPVEVAHRSTTLCSIGAISMLLRRKLTWDPVKEEFLGDEEANRLRSRAMREPWHLG
jgi:predicted dehydrogenase